MAMGVKNVESIFKCKVKKDSITGYRASFKFENEQKKIWVRGKTISELYDNILIECGNHGVFFSSQYEDTRTPSCFGDNDAICDCCFLEECSRIANNNYIKEFCPNLDD